MKDAFTTALMVFVAAILWLVGVFLVIAIYAFFIGVLAGGVIGAAVLVVRWITG